MGKKEEIRDTLLFMARECVAVRVRLLNRLITNIYDSALKDLGIKLSQLNILVVIYLAGEVGYDDISKRLIMEKSTVSRNIDRMVKKGLLEVFYASGSNKKMLRVSPYGEELLENVYERWKVAQDKALSLFGKDFSEQLILTTNKIWKDKKKK